MISLIFFTPGGTRVSRVIYSTAVLLIVTCFPWVVSVTLPYADPAYPLTLAGEKLQCR